jgi:acetylornithine deacetylase/succinyl-diaminopimelate desuccinylase-like protein
VDIPGYVTAHADGLREQLTEWLSIASVSADPQRAGEVRRSAGWLAAALRQAGFPNVEIWDTPGHPAVYAHWPVPQATRVLVYGHHDVQPVDPESDWVNPPFTPTMRGEELFARGAADDKGQVAFHLLGLAAHLAVTGAPAPAVDLKVLVEGEEEIGSPNFRALLEAHRDELACDVVVVSDTGMYAREVPSVCTGMRGLAYCQVDVRGADVDLHSGSFGGAVPNPATALAELLAALHDGSGQVAIPGFYDRVAPLTDAERELFAKLPFDEGEFLRTATSRAISGEAGYSTLERIWARPTCEVNGFWGGYTGPGQKTIIPAEAHAKVSFRLVPDQDPDDVERLMRDFVEAHRPTGLSVEVAFFGGVRPCRTPLDCPELGAVRRAMQRAFGAEILITREGGSGPEADLGEVLAAPVVFLGVGLPDDRIHAPNERVVFPLLLKGAEAAAYLWEELATTR